MFATRRLPSAPFRVTRPLLIAAACVGAAPSHAQSPRAQVSAAPVPAKPPELANLEWRSLGPALMIGRVADVEGVPGNPALVYVGSASGGIWKTINAGTTWTPVFDAQPVQSIGDLALEPGNPEVVYAGTGEGNPRNSVSFGNGVYKSTDGGRTWRHLGLERTRYVTRVLVHPRDPRIVFVGALGSVFGPGPDRGVFRSLDGGETWEKTLYVDERHGVSDMDLDRRNPNVVFAAMWRFERKPWTHTTGSEQGGVFRSVDGGKTWTKLEKGLPALAGRIAVKVAPSNPQVVYVLAESHEGTLFKSVDGGESFAKVSDETGIIARGLYYTDLRVDPADENRVYAVASQLQVSIDGGKTFKRISQETHIDFHSLWIDPANPDRMWQGQDGGVAVSYDRGQRWSVVNNFAVTQFYQVMADNREPFYWVGGGLQDNGVWRAPSRTREPAGVLNDEWRMVNFGDGFYWLPNAANPDLSLSLSQGGNLLRTDMHTREQQMVSPQARANPGGPASGVKYRFNWNAPLVASPHDPQTVYFGANVLFKSKDFGTTWAAISPDLTTNDPAKLTSSGGPAWKENTTAEYYCTIVSVTESPAQEGVLWVGTDDGRVHVSRDGGASWKDVAGNIPGAGATPVVSHVEASRTAPGTAWVALDRHMFDDFAAHIYETADFGRTWRRVSAGLPEGAWVWVVREDPKVPGLLYAGTEVGLYATRDRGATWFDLGLKNLPRVSVHDLYVHPRENDIILGTHGRGLYILDDATAVQRLGDDVTSRPAHLFEVRRAWRYTSRMTRYGIGDGVFRGANPPAGALITYFLREKPGKDTPVTIEILDEDGRVVRQLKNVPSEAGVNRTNWDLAYETARPRRQPRPDAEAELFPRTGPKALPGTYRVRLTIANETLEQPVEVRLDPSLSVDAAALKQQFDIAIELRDLESSVNDVLRGFDNLEEQAEDRRRTARAWLKDVPPDLTKTLDAFVTQVQEASRSLARPQNIPAWADGPRLAERLAQVSGQIGGVHAAPTRAQAEYVVELRQEAAAALSGPGPVADAVAALNAALSKFQLSPVRIAGRAE